MSSRARKENGSGNIMEALLTRLLSDRFAALATKENGHRSEEGERLRKQIRQSMKEKKESRNRATYLSRPLFSVERFVERDAAGIPFHICFQKE